MTQMQRCVWSFLFRFGIMEVKIVIFKCVGRDLGVARLKFSFLDSDEIIFAKATVCENDQKTLWQVFFKFPSA